MGEDSGNALLHFYQGNYMDGKYKMIDIMLDGWDGTHHTVEVELRIF